MADREAVRHQHGFHRLRVKAIVQETHDTRSFALDVPADLAELFRYEAGQFCTFRVRTTGGEHLRCYSMSSAPETDPDLTVTVKRVPGGVVSNWFHDHVSPGDVLEVTRPSGVFTVREGHRPVVAFCGGSGVTPVMSIAKSVLGTADRPVRLLYANRDDRSVIFDDELSRLRDAHPDRMEIRHHLDSAGGYLDTDGIADFARSTLDADFYICGPGPFMDLVEAALKGLGVEADRIAIERFDVVAQPPSEPATSDTGADPEVPESVTIVLKGTSTTIAYQPGDTVLDTARRGGLQAPFSCEAGNCATCMALLREGSARMRVNNALTPEEVEEGWILTCQSLPSGSKVTVEYEDL